MVDQDVSKVLRRSRPADSPEEGKDHWLRDDTCRRLHVISMPSAEKPAGLLGVKQTGLFWEITPVQSEGAQMGALDPPFWCSWLIEPLVQYGGADAAKAQCCRLPPPSCGTCGQ